MTHNQPLDDLRAEIEGMTKHNTLGPDLIRREDVIHAINRLEGHLTAMEALEALVEFCCQRANMESINVEHRQAYEQAWQHGVNLRNRVAP